MKRYDKYEIYGPIHHDWYKTEAWYKEIIDFVLSKLEGDGVLDLGCGDGIFLKLAEEKGFKIGGIDDNFAGIKFARIFCHDITNIIQADVNNFEWSKIPRRYNRPFDTIVCVNSIEHFENPANVGDIFKSSTARKFIVVTNYPNPNGVGRYHFNEYEPKDLIKILRLGRLQYEVTDLINGDYKHYAIEFWK